MKLHARHELVAARPVIGSRLETRTCCDSMSIASHTRPGTQTSAAAESAALHYTGTLAALVPRRCSLLLSPESLRSGYLPDRLLTATGPRPAIGSHCELLPRLDCNSDGQRFSLYTRPRASPQSGACVYIKDHTLTCSPSAHSPSGPWECASGQPPTSHASLTTLSSSVYLVCAMRGGLFPCTLAECSQPSRANDQVQVQCRGAFDCAARPRFHVSSHRC
jgi:hypothetical protein